MISTIFFGNIAYILTYIKNINLLLFLGFFLIFSLVSFYISKRDIKEMIIEEKSVWFLNFFTFGFVFFILRDFFSFFSFSINLIYLILISLITTDIIISYKNKYRRYIEFFFFFFLFISFLYVLNYTSNSLDIKENLSFYPFLGFSFNYIIFTLLSLTKNLGEGDRDIGITAGLLFGPLGIFNLFIAASISSFYYLIQIFSEKEIEKEIPFGPYLLSGIGLSFLFLYFFF